MALDTTSGGSAADSYASLAEANAYFTARGITTWTGTDTVKENALRRAASYLDNQYRGRWVGIRTNETQALAWPRVMGYRGYAGGLIQTILDVDGFEIASDAIPTQLKNAQIEAALLILSGVSMEPTLSRGGMVKSKQIGPLSITYMDGASPVDRYLAVEGLLRGLVNSNPGDTTGNTKLVRA